MVPHHKPRGWIHCSALQGKRVKGQETIKTAKASADVGKNETHRSAPMDRWEGCSAEPDSKEDFWRVLSPWKKSF